jgi:predicted transcriptional regulator/transcriptional regulator with XRE-family HTH domain
MKAGERKLFAGERLRRLREGAGMTQAATARAVGLSASYLNQIERDQRPLPRAVRRRLCGHFGVGVASFADDEDLRKVADLREATADPLFATGPVDLAEVQSAVRAAPAVAERFLALYRAFLALDEEHRALREHIARDAGGPGLMSRLPYDEVRDWVQSHRNHFAPLDEAAEALYETQGFAPPTLREDLRRRLRDRHGVSVTVAAGLPEAGLLWRFDRGAQRLLLADEMAPESENFSIAHVIGLLEQDRPIEALVAGAGLSSDEARALARVGLANYFAGALVLPYRRFHAVARALRHDIERLQRRFGTSFEQVCHRLSTLQRPGLSGVPFYFLKADIAGNVAKRSSAARFQFARFGGACPLWNVHQAFAQPGRILVQLAAMPDGATYLSIARTVGSAGSFLSRPRETAVGLGCDVAHADQLVYSAGLDVRNPEVVVPIGPGCRACERPNCRHRAMPPVGHALDVGAGERGVVPYRIVGPAT